MITEFDAKGKLYTDVVLKKNIPATIQTLSHRIHGEVHVRPEERLVDELNHADKFLAITKATVYDSRGQKIYTTEFIAMNTADIIWLIPDEELTNGEEMAGNK